MRQDSTHRSLKLLIGLRAVSVFGQALILWVAMTRFHLPLPLKSLLAVLLGLALVDLLSAARLRLSKPVGSFEFLCQLTIDLAALYLMLQWSGGAANPFASAFILQVVIAAIILPPALTWLTAILGIGFYTALLIAPPLTMEFMEPMQERGFHHHVLGMWGSFVLLSLIVAGFVARLNATIRRQESLLAESERVAALGLLATSAAHELGTPLMTLSLLAEAYPETTNAEERQAKSALVLQQIARCKAILSGITAAGGVARAEKAARQTMEAFLTQLSEQWRSAHPATELHLTAQGPNERTIAVEDSLRQALVNLLDNAADASPRSIRIEADWNARRLIIAIRDDGPGMPEAVFRQLGEPGVSGKIGGMGMGIFLSRRAIERLGGTLHFDTAPEGTSAIARFPMKRLSA